jgi:hypothetical protein
MQMTPPRTDQWSYLSAAMEVDAATEALDAEVSAAVAVIPMAVVPFGAGLSAQVPQLV